MNNNNCITCVDRFCHVQLTGECLRDLTGEKILGLLEMNVSGITPIHVVKRVDQSFAFAHFATKTAASIFFLRFEPFPWPERSNLPGLEVKPCRDENGDTIVYINYDQVATPPADYDALSPTTTSNSSGNSSRSGGRRECLWAPSTMEIFMDDLERYTELMRGQQEKVNYYRQKVQEYQQLLQFEVEGYEQLASMAEYLKEKILGEGSRLNSNNNQ